MTQFLGELLNMCILDSGCTQTVCGKDWLEIFKQTLPSHVSTKLILEKSERVFRFGDGESVRSIGKIVIPIYLQGIKKAVGLETDVVNKELPLLLSRSSMRKANTIIAFNNKGEEVVTMFSKRQYVQNTSSGHLCIPVVKFYAGKNENLNNETHKIFFAGNFESLTTEQKRKLALKLHEQFAHPVSKRLIKLLKDGGVDNKGFHDLVEEVTKACPICQKYKRASLKPIVCFPRATEFNENVAFDLKMFSKQIMLHIIDHFTRFSRAIITPNKEAETIVDGFLKSWIAIFGPPKSVLSDNGGEFNNEKFNKLCEKMNIVLTGQQQRALGRME